jgi:hypothetical protein
MAGGDDGEDGDGKLPSVYHAPLNEGGVGKSMSDRQTHRAVCWSFASTEAKLKNKNTTTIKQNSINGCHIIVIKPCDSYSFHYFPWPRYLLQSNVTPTKLQYIRVLLLSVEK